MTSRPQMQYRVFGLRRSGNHAVIYWITRQHEEPVLFLNDMPVGRDPLDPLTWDFKTAAYNTEDVGHRLTEAGCLVPWAAGSMEEWREFTGPIIISYENVDLRSLTRPVVPPGSLPGEPSYLTLVRDLPNWLSSFIRKQENAGVSVGREEVDYYIDTWRMYAMHHCGAVDYFGGGTSISFNLWKKDAGYREQLSRSLGLRGGKDTSHPGAGSSFGGPEGVFRRWEHLKGAGWMDLLEDRELRDLSVAVDPASGFVFDTLSEENEE